MLASKLGIRLMLLLGKNAPTPASAEVMAALQRVEVTNDMDGEDGFQLVFTVSKGKQGEFGLLRSGALDPDTRAVIGVLIGAKLQPLMDGVIYHQQLVPAQEPGTSTLTVMGRSIQVMLDLEKKNKSHPKQSASAIVNEILSHYETLGIIDRSGITTTADTPSDKERIPQQQGTTDLAYIRQLAKQNGFVFYLEPKTLGTTAAYWGPADRTTNSLPPLCVNLGSATNVTDLHFGLDALAPVQVGGETIDPNMKKSIAIPALPQPPASGKLQSISARRSELVRDAARLGPAGAQDAAAAMAAAAPDPVKTQGTLDTVRYGDVLRTRRTVSIRGGGHSYDGDYLVRQVTHEIEVGKYTQRFTLSRKGLAAAR